MRDRSVFDLFLISWVVLFLELACIRWFPSHVLFLTFFTNTVLLACFVGMSVGCLVARRPVDFIRWTPYLLALSLAGGLLIDRYSYDLSLIFAVGNPANPDVVFFGTEHVAAKERPFVIPIEFVGGLYFLLIAAIMVGPGQEMGRAFNRVSNRTSAYSANLLGSLVGIGMFAGCSYLQLPPIVWFAVVAVALAYFLVRTDPDLPAPQQKTTILPLCCLAAAVVITGFTSGLVNPGHKQIAWSPYYRVDYHDATRFIVTNLISHQIVEPVNEATNAPYSLPYLFQRDVKKADGTRAWPEFKRVLIIGAGSGNDVARACRWIPKDAQIDAVEIDPVIQKLGVAHHPDRPFDDPRVKVTINDGRNFLRSAEAGTYDLVIFALIDSLVLQSGYSNLRLESYLFTLDSFKDVHRVLKPTGVYAVYNFFRQGWLACRIREQLRTAFDGVDPVVMTTPPMEAIPLNLFTEGFTLFFAGSQQVIDPLRAEFSDPSTRYWYPWRTGVPKDSPARFSAAPPAESAGPIVLRHGYELKPEWMGFRIAVPEETSGLRQATDDWPFLYTREPTIPGLSLRGIALTLALSVLLWYLLGGHRALASESGTRPEWGLMARSFFLGAGFMLVETKAVVQMALLFGGTWMVNTVVFAAILVMSLAGNLFAGRVNPKRLEPYYVGLFVALGIGLAVPPGAFLGLSPTVQLVGVCAIVFAPIAFAGVIFATTFKRTSQPDRVFGANVAGALVGGLAENTSVLLGFQLLLCVAVGFYAFSSMFGSREVSARVAE